MIRSISPTDQIPIMFFPLFLVIVVNALRDFIEDKKRQNSDKEENNQKCKIILGNGLANEVNQEKLRVGEIIRLEEGSNVPSDCVVVGSSEPNQSCLIETKNLDGEVSLKKKESSRLFRKSEYEYQDFFRFDSIFEIENPNINLYQFNGTLKIRGELFPITNDNFLPRGSMIMHTSYVIAVVVYTGYIY